LDRAQRAGQASNAPPRSACWPGEPFNRLQCSSPRSQLFGPSRW
jgi:hypothetical protein